MFGQRFPTTRPRIDFVFSSEGCFCCLAGSPSFNARASYLSLGRKNRMGTTYRYLSSIEEGSTVSDWFRALPERPVENSLDGGTTFYFGDFGPLGLDARTSPVVSVFLTL